MRLLLIRHGLTAGNLEKKYIGCRTDEALCEEGIKALRGKNYPACDRLFVSPMKRCVETARILFPGMPYTAVKDFRECDFGAFEGENYQSLNGRADYQAWIDSGGEAPFPGGESRVQFAARCVSAFETLGLSGAGGTVAIGAHGGTVMAIMEQIARPEGRYFDFQIPCGEGFAVEEDGSYRRLEG